MNWYPLGSPVRITGTFKAGSPLALADPTGVTLKLRKPDKSLVTVSDPTHDSLGKFHYDLMGDQPGVWTYIWVGTGAVEVTAPAGAFTVGKGAS